MNAAQSVTVRSALSVTSGVKGADGSGTADAARQGQGGAGGNASFTAGTLSAPTIKLTKNDGALNFTVTNLQIGSTDTTLTANGIDTASITNLRLTGTGGKFTLEGDATANVSVGQLVIDGGTINSGNYANLIGGSFYTTSDITLGSGGAKFDTSGGNQMVNRKLEGAGSLTKTGAGELILSNTNTYTGGTKISNGILSIAASANIGPVGNGVNEINGGTLKLTGTSQTYTNNWTLTGSGNNIETANPNTISGILSGTGGFTKTGAGTLTLSNANTYGGATTISAGTLALFGNGSIAFLGQTAVAGNVAAERAALNGQAVCA
ncbi:hypothetical protein FACS189475_10020 [Betaproteobacteria bacterium]|nr:hypothetical protein FACS189475_10020 [Betaproteobacteria bacterium]